MDGCCSDSEEAQQPDECETACDSGTRDSHLSAMRSVYAVFAMFAAVAKSGSENELESNLGRLVARWTRWASWSWSRVAVPCCNSFVVTDCHGGLSSTLSL